MFKRVHTFEYSVVDAREAVIGWVTGVGPNGLAAAKDAWRKIRLDPRLGERAAALGVTIQVS